MADQHQDRQGRLLDTEVLRSSLEYDGSAYLSTSVPVQTTGSLLGAQSTTKQRCRSAEPQRIPKSCASEIHSIVESATSLVFQPVVKSRVKGAQKGGVP